MNKWINSQISDYINNRVTQMSDWITQQHNSISLL